MFDLHQIRSFCLVAEEMHVTRAAQRLRMAQPALTRQVKALERELGVALLRRVGRHIELTDAGSLFYAGSVELLRGLDTLRSRTLQAARDRSGQLLIGLCGGAGFSPRVSKTLASFRGLRPGIRLDFVQERTPELLDALLSGRLDVAFMRPMSIQPPFIQTHAASEDPISVAIPRRHPLAKRKALALKDLAQEELTVVTAIDHFTFNLRLKEACEREQISLRTAQESPDLMTALHLVYAGIGITFVPRYLSSACGDEIRCVPLKETPVLHDDLCLVTANRPKSDSAIEFCGVASRIFGDGSTPRLENDSSRRVSPKLKR